MDTILFINACVRPGSRTLALAQTLLENQKGHIQEVRLWEKPLPALDLKSMEKRDEAAGREDFSDPMFDAAKAEPYQQPFVAAWPKVCNR